MLRKIKLHKKLILFVTAIVGIIFIIFLAVYVYTYTLEPRININNQKDLIAYLTSNNFEEYAPKDRLDKALKILDNNSLPNSERYKALTDIAYYIQDSYYRSNNPEIRSLLVGLDEITRSTFPDQYNPDDILVLCADPKCGSSIDPILKNLKDEIKSLNAEEEYLNTILTNFRIALYIPEGSDNGHNTNLKLNSYSLVYYQLNELGTSQASASAEKLNDYAKDKYDIDLSIPLGDQLL